MQDYTVQRCSRKCGAQNRPLEPGERYVSAVVDNGTELVRLDICESAWSDPPEGCVGWWRTKMPEAKTAKRVPAPNQVLIETLARLCENRHQEQPTTSALAYLLAILLLRKRILEENHSEAPNMLHLIEPVSGAEFDVQSIELPVDQMSVIEEQLVELLFVEQ